MSTTEDRNDPGLDVIRDDGQQEKYLVLSEDERNKGFVRPYRDEYKHAKCNGITRMGRALSETYASDPKFYGGTFCAVCSQHYPVSEFIWTADGEVVGS